jgi:hypothetical protein
VPHVSLFPPPHISPLQSAAHLKPANRLTTMSAPVAQLPVPSFTTGSNKPKRRIVNEVQTFLLFPFNHIPFLSLLHWLRVICGRSMGRPGNASCDH